MVRYKFGSIPGSKSYVEDLADFWEILALQSESGSISKREVFTVLTKELDEELVSGIESDDDKLTDRIEDVWSELERRTIACGGGYPFHARKNHLTCLEMWNDQQSVYIFMLLATRLNMKDSREFGGVDGAKLFEHICASVASNYFGANAIGMVFGTAVEGNFVSKVRNLASQLGEGGDFRNPNPSHVTKNDDGIDVVVWKEFADHRQGKLIGFGQCKTGTTWRDAIKKLDTTQFCKNWFTDSFVIDPIPMVFLCDTMNIDHNFITDQSGYLILNRFRITEYATMELEPTIASQLELWLAGVLDGLRT